MTQTLKKDEQLHNVDESTVNAFDDQWKRFYASGRQNHMEEQRRLFDRFFTIFPKEQLHKDAIGAEFGCGTGRFAQFVAPLIGKMHCIDASPTAIESAKDTLKAYDHINFIAAPIDAVDPGEKLDFAYSYGVLMHIPDTARAMKDCTKHLKSGAPFLVYIYYRFDNKPLWYKAVWHLSELPRAIISKLPMGMRSHASDILTALIYWPLARAAKLGEKLGFNVDNWILNDYRNAPYVTLRNTCRDRFGTPLEQRFTKSEMTTMMQEAGLENISFHEGTPYWCAIGYKK